MRAYRKELDLILFPYPCECLIEKCYVKNNVGDCDQKEVCASYFQMNRISGSKHIVVVVVSVGRFFYAPPPSKKVGDI